ncbi:MAG: hypothetical protein HY270_12675 [Deltaproteobacteria bacterium]|nr:hypothetical protein [Deltaproteobacteria bacterium]
MISPRIGRPTYAAIDEAVGETVISMNEVGSWQDRVSDEVLTRLGRRIPRLPAEEV